MLNNTEVILKTCSYEKLETQGQFSKTRKYVNVCVCRCWNCCRVEASLGLCGERHCGVQSPKHCRSDFVICSEKLTVTWLKTDFFSYPLFFILLSFRVTYYFVTIDIGVGFDFEICSTMQRAQNFTKYYVLTLPSAFAEGGSRH